MASNSLETLLCRRRVLSVVLDRDIELVRIGLVNGDALSMSLMTYERIGAPRPGQVLTYEIKLIEPYWNQKNGFRRVPMEKGELAPHTLPEVKEMSGWPRR